MRAPVPAVRTIATVLELAGRLTGTRPLMDRNMVDEFAGRYGFMHSAKAERELGIHLAAGARRGATDGRVARRPRLRERAPAASAHLAPLAAGRVLDVRRPRVP